MKSFNLWKESLIFILVVVIVSWVLCLFIVERNPRPLIDNDSVRQSEDSLWKIEVWESGEKIQEFEAKRIPSVWGAYSYCKFVESDTGKSVKILGGTVVIKEK